MTAEVIQALGCRPGGLYLDCTVGGGGHAAAILEASDPDGRLIGIDRDEAAIRRAGERLRSFGRRVHLVRDTYLNLEMVLASQGVAEVDGILMDLGVSSFQFGSAERGFSFQREGPLDMRMDRRAGPTAADLVNTLPEAELEKILFEYGEEPRARRIASAIGQSRKQKPISTTLQLAELVSRAAPRGGRTRRLHPATRTFQALRIAVNDEIARLEEALRKAVAHLKPDGRLCVISFHSLEDRIAKNVFRDLASERPVWIRRLTKKPVVPVRAEILDNPRARSAKLRAIERMGRPAQETPTPEDRT